MRRAPRVSTIPRKQCNRPRSFSTTTPPPVKRPTLYYFNLRARAESIRLVLEESGVKYDFKAIDSEAMAALKQSGKLPFGQVPFYEDENVSLAQSRTIVRYLAKKHNLLGANETEAWHIDEIFEGTLDLSGKLRSVLRVEESKREAAKKELLEKTLPTWLGHFERILQKNSRTPLFIGFAVGNQFSLADLVMFNAIDTILNEAPSALEKFPRLKSHQELVKNRPRIQAYLSSDRRPAK